jgi:hypothetical protein
VPDLAGRPRAPREQGRQRALVGLAARRDRDGGEQRDRGRYGGGAELVAYGGPQRVGGRFASRTASASRCGGSGEPAASSARRLLVSTASVRSVSSTW